MTVAGSNVTYIGDQAGGSGRDRLTVPGLVAVVFRLRVADIYILELLVGCLQWRVGHL